MAAACGDGILQTGEECDDGNLTDGDWCDAACDRECEGLSSLGDVRALAGDSCYVYFGTASPWGDAEATCALLGAHLAAVGSEGENAAVAAVAAANTWIGLTDRYGEGAFVWYAGPEQITVPTYTNWAATQPDDAPGGAGDCVALVVADGTWLDDACATERGYVCEYEW